MNSICITQVFHHFDKKYIEDAFHHYHIGKIKNIRFVNTDSIYKAAFIDLYYWNETKYANELKKQIFNKDEIGKIYYCKHDCWMVYPNVNVDSTYPDIVNYMFQSLTKVQDVIHSLHSSPSVSPITIESDIDLEKGMVFPEFLESQSTTPIHDDSYNIDIYIPLHKNPSTGLQDQTDDSYYTNYNENNYCFV